MMKHIPEGSPMMTWTENDMLGKIVWIQVRAEGRDGSDIIKTRPGLIIGATNGVYVAIPFSSQTPHDKEDRKYALCVDPKEYPALNLKRVSWIKPQIQTFVYPGNVEDEISDMARQYPELYKAAIKVSMEWNQKMYMDNMRHIERVENTYKRKREQKVPMKNRKTANRQQPRKTKKEKGMKRIRQREDNEWRGRTR